jgi:glycosyltransferase involved in cell wall biosynthesis
LANNLKQLIDAAELLKDFPNMQFLIYGDGEDREYLENYCKEKNISNVVFKQRWVELKYIPYILSKSSLNILNYKNSEILRFGGSQSKSFQYMASGKPICANVAMNYCPINQFKLGIAKEFHTSNEYASAIKSIYELKENQLSAIKRYINLQLKLFYQHLNHDILKYLYMVRYNQEFLK